MKRRSYRAPIGVPAAAGLASDPAGDSCRVPTSTSAGWKVQARKHCTAPMTRTVTPNRWTSTRRAGRWVKYWV